MLTLDGHGGFFGQKGGIGSLGVTWFAVLWVILLYLRQKHPTYEFPGLRMTVFFIYGALPALLNSSLVGNWIVRFFELERGGFRYTFLVVGPLEEGFKILGPIAILGVVKKWRDNPYAWFMAALASGAGFGCGENLMVYTGLHVEGNTLELFLFRTGAILHLFLTGTLGYFLATRGGRPLWIMVMFVVVSGVHGLWNLLAFHDLPWLLPVILFLGVTALMKQVRWLTVVPAGEAEDEAVPDSDDSPALRTPG